MSDKLIEIKVLVGDSPAALQKEINKATLHGWVETGDLFNATIQTNEYNMVDSGWISGNSSGLFSSGEISGNFKSDKPTETTKERYCQKVTNNGTPIQEDDEVEWGEPKTFESETEHLDYTVLTGKCRGTILYKAQFIHVNGFKAQMKFESTDPQIFQHGYLDYMLRECLYFVYGGSNENLPIEANIYQRHDKMGEYYVNDKPFEGGMLDLIKMASEEHFADLKGF